MSRVEVEIPMQEVDGAIVPLRVFNTSFAEWFSWLLGALPRYAKNIGMLAKAHAMALAAAEAKESFAIDETEWHALCAELSKEDGPSCGFAPPLLLPNGSAAEVAVFAFFPFVDSVMKAKPVPEREC